MKAKTACLTWLVVYLLLALGMATWAFLRFPVDPHNPPEQPFRVKVAVGAGFGGALLPLFALSALHGAWTRTRERARLVRAARGGSLPPDGENAVFYGPIHRDGPPLVAPLSGRDCLLYRYEIVHHETAKRTPGGGTLNPDDSRAEISRTIVDAEGFGLTPSTIQTAAGPVRLLTLVVPEFQAERFLLEDIAGRVEDHLSRTTFTDAGSITDVPQALRALLKDTDGAIRYDRGRGQVDPSDAPLLQEHVVQHGDTVCVFGRYSAVLGGVVSDPDSLLPIPTRLRKGPLEALTATLVRDAIWYALGGVGFAAATAGAVWAFFRFGPSWW